MNMQNLMAQAKKIQGEMERLTTEIENKEFTASTELVTITATGKNEIKKIEILDEKILESKEIVEDMILIAVNQVLSQIKKEKNEKLGKFTGGMGGLF